MDVLVLEAGLLGLMILTYIGYIRCTIADTADDYERETMTRADRIRKLYEEGY